MVEVRMDLLQKTHKHEKYYCRPRFIDNKVSQQQQQQQQQLQTPPQESDLKCFSFVPFLTLLL
jgi:hypothetical protein